MRILHCTLALAALASLPSFVGLRAEDAPVEAGYTSLFNGQDLSGWQLAKGGESLDGKTETAEKRFTVKDGCLVIDPAVKKDMIIQTAQPLAGQVVVKFEYLPGAGCNNDLFLHGVKFDIKPSDVKNLKEGEWNQFEIVRQGNTLEFKSNGTSVKTLPTKNDSSPLGIRAEFGAIQYRNIRVKQGS